MVEGHSVHRVAARHRQKLVGKKFACTSPNGRFTEGAAAINNKTFRAIEAINPKVTNIICAEPSARHLGRHFQAS